ncbi:MAG: hemolysin family protein [bacterium]
MSSEYLLLALALILSAFFSGSETAYTTAGRLAMEVYSRHNRPGSRAARHLYERPALLFSTTLVGTNLVGVVYSSLAAIVLQRLGFPIQGIVILSSAIILVFGEVLPKAIAREHPERWAMAVAWSLRFSYIFLYPFILFARTSSSLLLRIFGVDSEANRQANLTLVELRGIWGDLRRSGALAEDEIKLLNHAVSLREMRIGDLMVPRTAISALSLDAPVDEAIHLVQARGYSRIPVYDNSLDHIVGILHAKRLLENPARLRDVLLEPLFVPEQITVPRFLEIARKEESGLAVVVDEYGGTAGIITLEDVIEILVGDIEDEHDRRSDLVRTVSTGSWLVQGQAYLDDLKEHFKIDLPSGDYETVGGLMIDALGRIPQMGETLQAGRWSLRVVAADPSRVKRILVRKLSSSRS